MKKQLNELKAGEIFTFTSNGLKFGVCDLDGNFKYRTCNKKTFKCMGSAQFVEVHYTTCKGGMWLTYDNLIFNCFIHGKGENKALYYEIVETIEPETSESYSWKHIDTITNN